MSGRRIAALLLHYQDNKHQTTAPQQRLYLPPSEKGLKKQDGREGNGGNEQKYENVRRDIKKEHNNSDYIENKQHKHEVVVAVHDIPVSDD